MSPHSQYMEKLTLHSVIRKDERVATLILSVNARVKNSPKIDSTRLVYSEMLLAGAGSYNRNEWQNALGELGSNITVTCSDGDIDFSVSTVDSSLAKTLKLFELLFSAPQFRSEELVRVKTYLTNNLKRAREDSKARSYQMFASQVFSKFDRRTTYGIDQLLKEVGNVTIEDVQALHTSLALYPWTATCGGSHKSVEIIAREVKNVRAGQVHTESVAYLPLATLPTQGMHVCLHPIPNKQNIDFSIGGTIPFKRTDPQYPAFMVAMSVLGMPGGFIGRLMSIVREKEGLTYGIYAFIEDVTLHETGVWRIATFFSPKDAVQGITSTFREVTRIHKFGISDDELKRFKTILSTRFQLVEDSLLGKVREKHSLAKCGVDDVWYSNFKLALNKVTRDEVNSVLKRYLNPKNCIISGAGPVASVEKKLKAFAD
jgi:zinc protease